MSRRHFQLSLDGECVCVCVCGLYSSCCGDINILSLVCIKTWFKGQTQAKVRVGLRIQKPL